MGLSKKKILITTLLLACLGILASSPFLYVKEISLVSQPQFVEEEAVELALDSLKGSHVLSLILFNKIEKKLNPFSEIQSLDVSFSSLNSIQVKLNERAPWISSVVDGQLIFIDSDGYVLTYNNSQIPTTTNDIFIFKGIITNPITEHQISHSLLSTLKTYVNLFENFLPNRNLLLERIHAYYWQLVIDDHVSILLGDLSNLDKKFNRINYYLNNLTDKDYRNLDYIDSRIDNKLLVKYARK